jgi:hypothetical protein
MAGLLDLLSNFGGDASGMGMPPVPAGASMGQVSGMLSELLKSLNRRPTHPGFSGESPDNPSGGMMRGAAESGAEPNEAWTGGQSPLPPKTNDPTSNQPEVVSNGVPLPRPDPRPIGAKLDAMAQGQPPAPPMNIAPAASGQGGQTAPAAAPSGIQGLLSRLLSPNNAGMFMALGSGLAGAPSFGQGLSRGLGRAAPFAQQLAGTNATVDALVKKGYSPNDAIAIASNKEALTRVIPQLFGGGTPKLQTVTGPDGMPQSAWVSEDQQRITPADLSQGPPKVRNHADYTALPVGTTYIDPKGTPRIKSAGGG